MINRSHVWFAAFVVILFAAGMASGVALDRAMGWGRRPGSVFRGGPGGPGDRTGERGGDRIGERGGGPGGPGSGRGIGGGRGQGGPPTEAFVNDLAEALSLTADQKSKITTILEASRPRLRTLQEEASKKFSDEQLAVNTEITKVLTPEQAKKLEELQKERRGGPFGFRGRGRR
jgi:Spy/CpxP family protein refolding chaperone